MRLEELEVHTKERQDNYNDIKDVPSVLEVMPAECDHFEHSFHSKHDGEEYVVDMCDPRQATDTVKANTTAGWEANGVKMDYIHVLWFH